MVNDAWHAGQRMSRYSLTLALSNYCHNVYFCEPLPFMAMLHSPTQLFRRSRCEWPDANVTVPLLSGWYGEIYRPSWVQKLQFRRRVEKVASFMRHRQGPLVLYLWHPRFLPYVGKLGEVLVVYHIHDDYLLYDEQDERTRARAVESEEALLSVADVIVVNGPVLARRKGLGEGWVNCPSAVNFAMFSGEENDLSQRPAEFPEGGPIAGYFGMINSKVDVKLLYEVIRRLPQWHFVFAGSVGRMSAGDTEMWKRIVGQKNVRYLGLTSQDVIALYTGHIDVGVMCYRRSGWAKYGFPLKLFEFLAAGKPVVSTTLESLSEYEDYIDLRDTPGEFAEALVGVHKADNSEAAASRTKLAKANSWDARARVVLKAVAEKLASK